jgi:glycosyltransferase involved in cell wall biosynthesis
MRIAYVALHFDSRIMKSGVGNKIQTQVRLWRELGHEARLFLLSRDAIDLENVEPHIFTSRINFPVLRPILRELDRMQALGRLMDSVASYKPDLIYLRYGLFTFLLQNLYKIAPVVVEINTNDVVEYRYRGLFFYLMNRFTRRIVLGRASGFAPVSREIAQLPQNRIFNRPMRVIANGIDLQRYSELPAPSNSKPVLAMVASPGYDWHGIDKLCYLASQCPDFKIIIVGYSADDIDNPIPPNLELPGFVSHDRIKNILARADVALGTLAWHRIKMEEGSTLKVVEALAYGIPVILGYDDTNLSGLGCDLILRLPNTERNVIDNIQQIRDFAYRMIGKRIDRNLVELRISQREKEKSRLAFFEEILGMQETERKGNL